MSLFVKIREASCLKMMKQKEIFLLEVDLIPLFNGNNLYGFCNQVDFLIDKYNTEEAYIIPSALLKIKDFDPEIVESRLKYINWSILRDDLKLKYARKSLDALENELYSLNLKNFDSITTFGNKIKNLVKEITIKLDNPSIQTIQYYNKQALNRFVLNLEYIVSCTVRNLKPKDLTEAIVLAEEETTLFNESKVRENNLHIPNPNNYYNGNSYQDSKIQNKQNHNYKNNFSHYQRNYGNGQKGQQRNFYFNQHTRSNKYYNYKDRPINYQGKYNTNYSSKSYYNLNVNSLSSKIANLKNQNMQYQVNLNKQKENITQLLNYNESLKTEIANLNKLLLETKNKLSEETVKFDDQLIKVKSQLSEKTVLVSNLNEKLNSLEDKMLNMQTFTKKIDSVENIVNEKELSKDFNIIDAFTEINKLKRKELSLDYNSYQDILLSKLIKSLILV